MRLDFKMLDGDSVLEAITKADSYTIYQYNNSFRATVYDRIIAFSKELKVGNLYECLDACNEYESNRYKIVSQNFHVWKEYDTGIGKGGYRQCVKCGVDTYSQTPGEFCIGK